jgi:Flp pilus assembly protein CpaB
MSPGHGITRFLQRLWRPRRGSTYFLLVVLLLTAGGGVYLWVHNSRGRAVQVAVADLPVFHQLSQSDLVRATVRQDKVPSRTAVDPASLVGRYTLAPMRRGHPFNLDNLGPKLPAGALADRNVVSLSLSEGDVGDNAVSRGDRVDVLLYSTSADIHRNGILHGAVVLGLKANLKQPGQVALICAFLKKEGNAS